MRHQKRTTIAGLLLLFLPLLSAISVNAQSVKGKTIRYFQAPAEGVKFKRANVYLSYDQALATAKKETQQAKNSALGNKFGALGGQIAKTANNALEMMDTYSKVLTTLEDDKGRFARWNFVPAYIIAKTENKKEVNVEIFILNETNPNSLEAKSPTSADKNGYYAVPYYVNVRYKISDETGKLIFEENLGALSGTMKTKDYTPPATTTTKSIGGAFKGALNSATKSAKKAATEAPEFPIEYKLGTSAAYQAVREAVFARFGFATLSTPMKLGAVKEAKRTKKMIKPTLAIFANKQSFLLSDDEKKAVHAFAEEIEKSLESTSSKTKWVALHDLALCYAWLENEEKASKYYQQYGNEIRNTLDKMECWNKVMKKEMTFKEMKAKCGSTFIGMKDQKKYALYNDIAKFVRYYPAGAKRYQKLFYTINRDLARFTDFYAVNDLLCQLYEIDFPYQFLPLNDMKGSPKDMKATITKEGMQPIEYRVKYNSKGRIKNFQADQVSILEDGTKEKLISRNIKPKYDSETGKYMYLVTGEGKTQTEFKRIYRPYYYGGMKYVFDPVASKTKATLKDITRSTGFWNDKTSNEDIQMKVDLDGKMYFTGKSSYFKANAFFKEMLNSYGIIPKRVDTKTKFKTEANINGNGIMTNWVWSGNVKTDLNGKFQNRTQNLTANKMVRSLKFIKVDPNGNPIKAEYTFQLKGSMNIQQKVSLKDFFATWGAVGEISNENFNVKDNGIWDCSFEYDAAGNWTKMKIGPYSAKREIKY